MTKEEFLKNWDEGDSDNITKMESNLDSVIKSELKKHLQMILENYGGDIKCYLNSRP